MMSGKKAKVLLVTVALLVAPLAGVVLLLYGAGQIAARRPRRPAADPYVEWLALRDLTRPRGAASEAPRRHKRPRSATDEGLRHVEAAPVDVVTDPAPDRRGGASAGHGLGV